MKESEPIQKADSTYKLERQTEEYGVSIITEMSKVEPQEPTRKLITDELTEWLQERILVDVKLSEILKECQSLKAKEIDNIRQGFRDGKGVILDKKPIPSWQYITQTYQPK